MARLLFNTEGGNSGGTATLSQADRDAIAKVGTLETQLTDAETRFSDDGKELTAGENVKQGDTRTYTLGDAVFTLENRVKTARKVANPIDVAEVNKWLIKSQFPPLSYIYPASVVVPKAYRLQHTDGSVLTAKDTFASGATIDLSKWNVEISSVSRLNDWIADAGDDYAEGDKLLKADDRRIPVGSVGARITYRGADKTAVKLDAAELGDWEIPNAIAMAYPGAVLAPRGFLYQRSENGKLLRLRDNRLLPATFDASQWDTLASDARLLSGEVFNILSFPTIPEKILIFNNCNLQNGPANSTQGVSGWGFWFGDARNGRMFLRILTSDNPSLTIGEWTTTLSTTILNGNDLATWTDWVEPPLARPYDNTANNGSVFTGGRYTWNLAHNIRPARISGFGDPVRLKPLTTWADYRPGSIQGITFTGTPPTSGTTEITIAQFNPGGWILTKQANPIGGSGITVHNFGVAGTTALKGSLHQSGEVHVEGGGNYSIAAADWDDGQWFRITHTAGANTAEVLTITGFTGVYLRDDASRDIRSGLFIGRQDCSFEVTVTLNGTNKYLNIKDTSIDAFSIAGYATPAAGITPGTLVNWDGTTMRRANAIAPNVFAATHYIDAVSGALTPLLEDGCIFTLPATITGVTPGQILYLGANGAFSTTRPAIATGNILQDVCVVRSGSKGRIRLGVPGVV